MLENLIINDDEIMTKRLKDISEVDKKIKKVKVNLTKLEAEKKQLIFDFFSRQLDLRIEFLTSDKMNDFYRDYDEE